jgi:hypothetical protein
MMSVLALMIILLVIMRVSARSRDAYNEFSLAFENRRQKLQEIRARRKAKLHEDAMLSQNGRRDLTIQREIRRVPAPWGWPDQGRNERLGRGEKHSSHRSMSTSLIQLADLLLHEKELVESREHVLHKNACVRALVEDRYGRVDTHPSMTQIEFDRVTAPLLRDPGLEPDQMDNFASRRADKMSVKIFGATKYKKEKKLIFNDIEPGEVILSQLKTPWGW